MTNKTICSAFWKHTNIRPKNEIYPCCRYKSSVQTFDGNVENILHSKEYEKLRRDSANGVENPNCQKCYNDEKLGKKSFRNWFNENYKTDSVNLEYIEIGFDNICNLSCDGCWEDWSSTWWKIKNSNLPPKQGILDTEDFFNIPKDIEKVVFLGGEPLMTNRHRIFLSSLEDLSKIDVMYYTNGMFKLTEKDHELLNQCKKVTFSVSIDGYKDLNEKVRTGSNWNTIVDFIDDCPYDVIINSVIHRNNWHGFRELYNWIKNKNLAWKINILTYPNNLCINNLDKEERLKLIDILKNIDHPDKDYIQNFLTKSI